MKYGCYLRLFALGFLLMAASGSEASASDSLRVGGGQLSVALSGSYNYLIPKGSHNQRVMHSYGVSYADLRLQWKPRQESIFDSSLNHPTLEAGLLFGDFTHVHLQDPDRPFPSEVGREATAYIGIQYDFWRKGRWRAGVDIQNGLAYFTRRFDQNRSPDNELVGSPLSVYIGLQPYVACRVTERWELAFAAAYRHVSNGTLNRPNLGANTIGPELRLAYKTGKTTSSNPSEKGEDRGEFVRSAYLESSIGIAGSTLRDQFIAEHSNHNPLYGTPIIMVAPMWRYSPVMASGIEANYGYSTYADHIRYYDEKAGFTGYDYSRHVLGVGLKQEFFYRHLSLHGGVGVYVYRHMGRVAEEQDGNTYQTIGLRYSLPCTADRVFIGYNVKAHNFSKADCMQLSIGYRLPFRR